MAPLRTKKTATITDLTDSYPIFAISVVVAVFLCSGASTVESTRPAMRKRILLANFARFVSIAIVSELCLSERSERVSGEAI